MSAQPLSLLRNWQVGMVLHELMHVDRKLRGVQQAEL
jgi:hypothetical protein